MVRHHPSSLFLRLVALIVLAVSAVVKPVIALACEVEDMRYAIAAAMDLDVTPDPDPEVDRHVHCCGSSMPTFVMVAVEVSLPVSEPPPSALPSDLHGRSILPLRRPPRVD